jgi:hypothetical protein
MSSDAMTDVRNAPVRGVGIGLSRAFLSTFRLSADVGVSAEPDRIASGVLAPVYSYGVCALVQKNRWPTRRLRVHLSYCQIQFSDGFIGAQGIAGVDVQVRWRVALEVNGVVNATVFGFVSIWWTPRNWLDVGASIFPRGAGVSLVVRP